MLVSIDIFPAEENSVNLCKVVLQGMCQVAYFQFNVYIFPFLMYKVNNVLPPSDVY